MKTPSEARELECRIGMIAAAILVTNDVPLADEASNCSADKCGHWRWVLEQEELPPERETKEFARWLPGKYGYCGLAVKP